MAPELEPWPPEGPYYEDPWEKVPRILPHPEDLPEPVVPEITVDIEENPVIGTLLGPDGEPVVVLRERCEVAFGFQGYAVGMSDTENTDTSTSEQGDVNVNVNQEAPEASEPSGDDEGGSSEEE